MIQATAATLCTDPQGRRLFHLIMQQGMRTLGSYNVFGNTMEIGVYTDDMEYQFGETAAGSISIIRWI